VRQVQNHSDQGNNDLSMDSDACARKSEVSFKTKKASQPQDELDYDTRPYPGTAP
jgi:hypothetical protein